MEASQKRVTVSAAQETVGVTKHIENEECIECLNKKKPIKTEIATTRNQTKLWSIQKGAKTVPICRKKKMETMKNRTIEKIEETNREII